MFKIAGRRKYPNEAEAYNALLLLLYVRHPELQGKERQLLGAELTSLLSEERKKGSKIGRSLSSATLELILGSPERTVVREVYVDHDRYTNPHRLDNPYRQGFSSYEKYE